MLLVIILSIPKVQTSIAEKVTTDLNETYGTDIHIHRLGLNWKGEVDIREVYIADHHQDTLIYAEQLQTNILSFRNLIAGDLGFGNIELSRAKLYVKTYKGEEDDNLNIFAEKFDTGEPSGNVFSLFGNDVRLTDSHVRISDENQEDPILVELKDVNLTADDFKITGPVVEAQLKELNTQTDFGFEIKNLKGGILYTLEKLELSEITLETEASTINGTIILNHGATGFGDFNNTVEIIADLKNTQIATNDLNTLYNKFGADQIIAVDGNFKGTLNNFTFENVQLLAGSSRIEGDFAFKNLFGQDKLYDIQLKNHSINTSYYELRRFMPRLLGDVLPEQLKPLGNITFNGTTRINGAELTTNSVLRSAIGNVTANAKMGNIDDIENAYYEGNIKLDQFNLGKIVGTTSLGKTTADLNLKGRGFTQNTVNTEVKGTITAFNFEGYNYQKIKVSGNLRNPLFNGNLTIDDPNLKLDFTGLIDASKTFNQYDFEANVEYAELNKLNLFKRDSISIFSGKVIMDMDGTSIDDAVGTIKFNNTFYQNEEDDFFFADFQVVSSVADELRTIEIKSPDIINGEISGKFLIEDIPNLFQNGIGSIYTNYIPSEVTTNQFIDYNFTVYNKIVDLFVPDLQLGENTQIKGSVSSDESKFKLDFRSPEILLFKNYLGKVNVQVDNNNPLYNTYVSVDSIYTGIYDAVDFSLINKTLNDTLYIRSEFKGGSRKEDLFNLSLYHTINKNGKSVVGVKKSDITYKDKVWFINENNNQQNKVVFDDTFKSIRIDSLVLSHENELIQMAGGLSDSTYKDVKVRFKDVNLGNITPYVDSLRLSGNINGSLDLLQKNGLYYPNASIFVDEVIINEVLFGDLDIKVRGNSNLTKYDINTTLTNKDVKSINAVGKIDVSPKNPTIDLSVDLNEFNMQAFSPFGGDVITNIRGFITGSAKISGDYRSPDIKGRFDLQNSGLKVPYLNTDFDMTDGTQVVVTKEKIAILKTGITDTKYETEGTFEGFATHKNFGGWELDLAVETDRLLVLDTPPEEDALYYGTAFISGTANIAGPIDELVVDVVATTERGTTFKIPISDTESIGDDSFIHFLSPEEKRARISGEQIVTEEIKGLSLNFELDINDNAEVEVVVDQVNNSTLTGRGAGILLLEINTLGKFRMWGDFLIIEGVYDFRYGGLIQRKIAVEPGGSIVWEGSPERAILNLSAVYTTEANPSILLDNPSFNRDIPVNVYVDLTGELIQPDLKFRVDFPRVSSIVKSELDFKLQNEEERQKQALFLVANNSFVNDNYEGAGTFGSSLLADRVSGLVNQLFADEDNKFKVGLDYQAGSRSPNQETSDRVGITFSTKVSERVLINGKVGVPVGGANESAIAGDLEVQWLINEDGSLRMKFFNRQGDIQFIGEDQIFEQGAGVSYSVDFDTMKELMQRLFNKKLTLAEDEEIPFLPDDNSFPVNFNKDGVKQEDEN